MRSDPSAVVRNFPCSGLPTLLLAALAFTALWAAPVRAHDPRDLIFGQVGVTEKLGERVPVDLSFVNQRGETVRLSRYFTGGPVIITLNYFACPTLCPVVLRNLSEAVGKLKGMTLGRDFRMVTVSIDPEEARSRAAEKAITTYAMLPKVQNAAEAWPFLLGESASIDRLTRSVGIRYSRLGKNDFAHPNVAVVVTPDGRISRYLYGLEPSPRDLQLALIESSGGRIGSSTVLNRALLYCFHYDPVGKKYVLIASRIMTGAMLGVLVLTLGLLGALWKRERGKR